MMLLVLKKVCDSKVSKKRSILGASPRTGREAAPDLNFQGLPNVAMETEG